MTRLTARIAQSIRERRLAAGLSQERLARKADVAGATVSRLERGATQQPRRVELEKIARALGTTADDLMGIGDDSVLDDAGGEPIDAFHHELARRYGSENAEFVDVVARKIQGFPPREAAFVRNLLMGAVRSADNPWRNSSDGTTDIVDVGATRSTSRTY